MVQIGITSIGILNGIVGDAAFSAPFAAWLHGTLDIGDRAARDHRHRRWSSSSITFLTIIFGELVPKRLGQLYPETIARLVARPMEWLSLVTRPFVRAAVVLHRSDAAAARHARRPRPQRHRGGDRRQPRGGARRRRDRGAGAPDGAQRVSPRRAPGRLDDDSARRDRLARGDRRRRTRCCA